MSLIGKTLEISLPLEFFKRFEISDEVQYKKTFEMAKTFVI